MTFRLKKLHNETAEDQLWALVLMQKLAKYVFEKEKVFDECHTTDAKGPIRHGYQSAITALLFVNDPELGVIDTPHGKVQFLQIVGLTTDEYSAFKQNENPNRGIELVERIRQINPLFITDLDRI